MRLTLPMKPMKVLYTLLICGIVICCYIIGMQRDRLKKNMSDIVKGMLNNDTIITTITLAQKLKCSDKRMEMQRVQYGSYWLLKNFVRGIKSENIGCADTITYATNGDYTFFWALPTVVKRWNGPVSFAIYAPGYDMYCTIESIQYVRNCLPESNLIRDFVTFHIYFPNEHIPSYMPQLDNDVFKWHYDCATTPPYGNDKIVNLYRKKYNMTYPINVGRNIARKASNTYFVFTSDIELFPSPGLIDKFLQMIECNMSLAINTKQPRVFVLNIFEVQENALLPNQKRELLTMFTKKQAIHFHSNTCAICHRLPYEAEWLQLTTVNEMSVLGIAKRQNEFESWEPFYISDNKEPMFDERVTWEGQNDKRIQGYAMCVLNYDYYILNDGFLVHSPGIKKPNIHDPRLKYVPLMKKFIKDVILKEYELIYGKNIYNCSV